MGRYIVNHNYQSSTAGLTAGVVVELDEDLAEWLNRDSPGVVTATDESEVESESEVEGEPEAEAEPATPKRSRAKG